MSPKEVCMDDIVGRLMRELPDTDRNRYDVAYARGRAQARSSLVAGGLAVGLAAGSLAMFLLDPHLGRGRRIEFRQRIGNLVTDLRGMISTRGKERPEATIPVQARPDLRTRPRSSVAPGASWTPTETDGREPVGAGVDR
jgi:hypothetical protein